MDQAIFEWNGVHEPPGRVPGGPALPLTLDEQWAIWSRKHSDVLRLFRKFAVELRGAGHVKGSSKLIWERIRWEHLTSAHGSGTPALNNNWTSRVSRWLIEVDPSFDGWFECRKLKSGQQG